MGLSHFIVAHHLPLLMLLGGVICTRKIAEAFTTKMFFNTYGWYVVGRVGL